MANINDVVVILSVQDVIFEYDAFSVSAKWVYSTFVVRTCSSRSLPSNCLLRISNTRSASCSISMRGTLLNSFILYIIVFVHSSSYCKCDRILMGKSACSALRLSCLCCHNHSSDGNSTSSVGKET